MHNAVQSSRTHAHAHVHTHTNTHAPFIKTIQQPVHVSLHLNRRIQERGIDVYGLTGEEIVFCTLSTGQINIQSVRETYGRRVMTPSLLGERMCARA